MTFWRKRKIAEQVENDIQSPEDNVYKNLRENYTEPVEKEPPHPAFQVGKTEDGRITLRLGGSYGISTLTMNNAGVDNLIRMLEAAKEPELDNTENLDD
jgi:hypothetical protein